MGIGFEPSSDSPNVDDATLVRIGRIFFDKRRQDFEKHIDFKSLDDQNYFYRQLGRDILDSVTNASDVDGSYWTWLDRPAVNRLIRLLRKARDNAFGRDE